MAAKAKIKLDKNKENEILTEVIKKENLLLPEPELNKED